MIGDKSLLNLLKHEGFYTRIQEVQERFSKRMESARDLANYYVCRHNLYGALAAHETNPKVKQRMKNKARNSMFALEKFRLIEQARSEDEYYDLISRCFLHLSNN